MWLVFNRVPATVSQSLTSLIPVMNLVGNSLKFTAQGWIRVSLSVGQADSVHAISGQDLRDIVTLIVEDTGKGITQEYLRTRLFSSFAQEDVLSPGTGLGLSLVKSIVDMLEGDIKVDSTVNQGTKVTINFPMPPRSTASEAISSTGTPSTGSTVTSDSGVDIPGVKRLAKGKRAACFTGNTTGSADSKVPRMTRHSIEQYMRKWFEIEIADSSNLTANLDVLVVEDFNVQELLEQLNNSDSETHPSAILVLCSRASQDSMSNLGGSAQGLSIYSIFKPFGPLRLARGLRACLQRETLTASMSSSSATPTRTEIAIQSPTPDPEKSATSDLQRLGLVHNFQQSGIVCNENSVHALMVMASPFSTGSTMVTSSHGVSSPEMSEFPFPGSQLEGVDEAKEVDSGTVANTRVHPEVRSTTMRHISEGGTDGPSARLLLVDDNVSRQPTPTCIEAC